jgi:hypothetical protein
MDNFPLYLSNKECFSYQLDIILIKKMRKKVLVHILKDNQNDFFDLELFDKKYVKNIKKTEEYSKIIIKELELLNWKTFIGYGGTGLFFYDNEKPANAW